MAATEFDDRSVEAAFERALKDATHLRVRDAAAVAAARVLARRIDIMDETGGLDENGKLDNVSIPTLLKYLGALGLVPPVAKASPGPASTASPAQQALNVMRAGLRAV